MEVNTQACVFQEKLDFAQNLNGHRERSKHLWHKLDMKQLFHEQPLLPQFAAPYFDTTFNRFPKRRRVNLHAPIKLHTQI